jgi:hypothetical protein
MKTFVCLLSIMGAAVLGMSIGNRIPANAVALAFGVALGALTAIPISLLLSVLVRRPATVEATPPQPASQPYAAPTMYEPAAAYAGARSYPPLVIINPSSFQPQPQRAYAAARYEATPLLGMPREFRIIGEETA